MHDRPVWISANCQSFSGPCLSSPVSGLSSSPTPPSTPTQAPSQSMLFPQEVHQSAPERLERSLSSPPPDTGQRLSLPSSAKPPMSSSSPIPYAFPLPQTTSQPVSDTSLLPTTPTSWLLCLLVAVLKQYFRVAKEMWFKGES